MARFAERSANESWRGGTAPSLARRSYSGFGQGQRHACGRSPEAGRLMGCKIGILRYWEPRPRRTGHPGISLIRCSNIGPVVAFLDMPHFLSSLPFLVMVLGSFA